MKKIILLLLIIVHVSCKKEELNIDPKHYLNSQEQSDFKYSIVRYIDDLARNASPATNFDTLYNSEYKTRAEKLDLLFYYKDSITNTAYYAVSKIAPSIKLKKVATVGQLKYGSDGKLVHYEEAFRTWKMEPKELEEKTQLLFRKYINNEDLSSYYTANSNPEYYIEFPDEITTYDTLSRSWKTSKK
jgi:hypothetical protein